MKKVREANMDWSPKCFHVKHVYICATENKVIKIHKHIDLQFGRIRKEKLLFASAERSWRRVESDLTCIGTLIASDSSLQAFIIILCINLFGQ